MVSTFSPPVAAEPKELLKISGLNVYYGESHILRNVDLQIPEGEMVCLIGRNGVGKTTLLKTVIGLLQQRSGTINHCQHDVILDTIWRQVSTEGKLIDLWHVMDDRW
jgi:urea transport system ATP-binding protein